MSHPDMTYRVDWVLALYSSVSYKLCKNTGWNRQTKEIHTKDFRNSSVYFKLCQNVKTLHKTDGRKISECIPVGTSSCVRTSNCQVHLQLILTFGLLSVVPGLPSVAKLQPLPWHSGNTYANWVLRWSGYRRELSIDMNGFWRERALIWTRYWRERVLT